MSIKIKNKDDINKAIGREGINIRLTNIVTGFNIEAIKAQID